MRTWQMECFKYNSKGKVQAYSTSFLRVAISALRALTSSELSCICRGVISMRGLCFVPSACDSRTECEDINII